MYTLHTTWPNYGMVNYMVWRVCCKDVFWLVALPLFESGFVSAESGDVTPLSKGCFLEVVLGGRKISIVLDMPPS